MKKNTNKAKCPSCGAEFDASLTNCPYCGTMNLPAAEAEYLGKMWGFVKKLEALTHIPGRIIVKFLKGFMVTAVLVIALFIGIGILLKSRDEKRTKDYQLKEVEDLKWSMVHFPEMERLYEEGKYDELAVAYMEADNDLHSLGSFKYREFCKYFTFIKKAEKYMDEVENSGASPDKLMYIELRMMTLDQFEKLTQEQREILEERSKMYIDDFYERFHPSAEEMEEFQTELDKHGYVAFDICTDYVKNHL